MKFLNDIKNFFIQHKVGYFSLKRMGTNLSLACLHLEQKKIFHLLENDLAYGNRLR